MILPPEDLEGSVIAPVVIPGVSDQPVGSSVVHAPAHDTNGVASKGRSFDVLVDSGLVVDEVGEDGEGGFGRSVGHQLVHDLLLVAGHVVRVLAEGLVLLKGNIVVRIFAFPMTLGSAAASFTGSPGSVDVMFAGLDVVWLAAVLGSVISSSDQTLAAPVAPGHAREPSVATEAAGVAAAQQVFSGHVVLEGPLAVDAHPVRH